MKTVRYSEICDQIVPGDVLALHDEFVASWYGLKIAAVQLLTGPYCHVAVLDRDSDSEVECYESVIPTVRRSPLVNVARAGFFWLPLNHLMTDAERRFLRSLVSLGIYSQTEAIAAGAGALTAADASDGRWECAKLTVLARLKSGVDLGPDWVPSKVVEAAMVRFNVQPIRVEMDMTPEGAKEYS